MGQSVLTADLLIPGRGRPFKDGAIVYEEGRITWWDKKSDIPNVYNALGELHFPVLMTGLWDCHVHFLGSQSYVTEILYRESHVLAGARATREVAEVLQVGFTSVRELVGYGLHLIKAIEEGFLYGPTIYAAGSVLSQTGGHGGGS
jgi:imidazolonepropionase-like amidohydrolase